MTNKVKTKSREGEKKMLIESFIYSSFFICVHSRLHNDCVASIALLISAYLAANFDFSIFCQTRSYSVDKRTHTCDLEAIHCVLFHNTIRKL